MDFIFHPQSLLPELATCTVNYRSQVSNQQFSLNQWMASIEVIHVYSMGECHGCTGIISVSGITLLHVTCIRYCRCTTYISCSRCTSCTSCSSCSRCSHCSSSSIRSSCSSCCSCSRRSGCSRCSSCTRTGCSSCPRCSSCSRSIVAVVAVW